MKDYKAFSLWIEHGKFKQRVDIPLTKRGIKGRVVGGKQTYLMAIDEFTMKFENIDELIDYIRKHNLAKIKTINNNEINVTIKYEGEAKFSGNLSLIFSDNKELLNFINTNTVKAKFEFLNPYVYNFQKFILENFEGKEYSEAYRIFMTNSNPYYGNDLTYTLYKHKQDILDHRELVIGPLSNYHNIRGNTLANKNLAYELQKIEYAKITPFNERDSYSFKRR